MPWVRYKYEDSGAVKVQDNLRKTEDATKKLGGAQDKAAASSASMQSKIEEMKRSLGIGAVNAAREMTTAVINMTKQFYEFAKAGATTERQRKNFEKFDATMERLSATLASVAAELLSDSGLLTRLGQEADKTTAFIDGLGDAVEFLGGDGGSEKGVLGRAVDGVFWLTDAIKDNYNPISGLKNTYDLAAGAIGWFSDEEDTATTSTWALTDAIDKQYEAIGKLNARAAREAAQAAKEEKGLQDQLDRQVQSMQKRNKEIVAAGDAYSKTVADDFPKFEDSVKKAKESTKKHTKAVKEAKEEVSKFAIAMQPLRDVLYQVDDVIFSISERLPKALDPEQLRQLALIGQGQFGVSEAPQLATESPAEMLLARQRSAVEQTMDAFQRSIEPVAAATEWMNSAFGETGAKVNAMTGLVSGLTKAMIKGGEAQETWGALISGGKAVTAAFIDDKRTLAAVLALWEQAEAIAAFATGNIAGGIGHEAASVAYGVVAAVGGGGSGGAGARGGAGVSGGMEVGRMGPDPFQAPTESGPRETTIINIDNIDPGKAGESVLDAIEAYGRRGGARKISVRTIGTNQGSQEY